MARCGHTEVLCTASVEESLPPFMRNSTSGWLTAEYAMLPRAGHSRSDRRHTSEGGRSREISRLIGRALRPVVDLSVLGPRQIRLDCDVLQADGGTRTTALNGAFVALAEALALMKQSGVLRERPLRTQLAAISVALGEGGLILEPDYEQDCTALADATVVVDDRGDILELQLTGEQRAVSRQTLLDLFALAVTRSTDIFRIQREALDSRLDLVLAAPS